MFNGKCIHTKWNGSVCLVQNDDNDGDDDDDHNTDIYMLAFSTFHNNKYIQTNSDSHIPYIYPCWSVFARAGIVSSKKLNEIEEKKDRINCLM